MTEPDDAPIDAPATWENVVVGKAKEVLGRALGDDGLAAEGEDQEDVAHEVREEFDEQQQDGQQHP
jgi:uncharacterized protein YjbJ (UPF0337 family)